MHSDTFNCIPVLFWLLMVCAPGAAQEIDPHQTVLDRIFADWENRREAMDAVEYQLTGTRLVQKGEFTSGLVEVGQLPPNTTEQIPPEDVASDEERRYVFDFTRNHFRAERRGQTYHLDSMLWGPRCDIHLYDGEHVQKLAPRAENTSPEVAPPEYQPELEYLETRHLTFALSFDMQPLFLAHGRPPGFNRPTEAYRGFTLPIQRDIFRWHADGVIDGRNCTVLRTINNPRGSGENYYEFWVDLERESAVPRCILYNNGNVSQLDVDHQETPHGWLPAHFTWTGTRQNGDLWVHYEFTVTEIVADPPLTNDLFAAEPERGMVVEDHATDERYVYGGPTGEHVDAREHYLETLRASQETNSRRWWVIAALAAVVAVVIGVLVRRRRSTI